MDQDPYEEEREAFDRDALPHSEEAERALVGSVFLENDLIAEAIEIVTPSDFYLPNLQAIYHAQTRLFEIGLQIEPLTVFEQLKKEGHTIIPSFSFMGNLTYGLPHTSSVAHYAKVIKGKSLLRQLDKAARKIQAEIKEEADDPAVIVENASKAVFDLALTGETKPGFIRVGPLVHRRVEKAYQIQQAGTAVTGITSGFIDLDAITSGFQRTDLILLAARPSMGKTAFALMLAQNAAIRAGARVAFFSLEMSDDPLGNRIICSEGRIDTQRFRNGYLNQQEWDRVHAVEEQLADVTLFINDTPAINSLGIRAKARRLMAEVEELDLIIVDYLQLMSGSGKRVESRQQEVSQISRELKSLAKELNVPLVALSQLSRAPESRSDHRPQLADLRESGALEQDGDVIIGLYDEDAYKSKTEHEGTLAHIIEAIVLKQRNGPTGTIALRLDKSTGRFDNLYDA